MICILMSVDCRVGYWLRYVVTAIIQIKGSAFRSYEILSYAHLIAIHAQVVVVTTH
jgi:hypothetical protein